MLLMDASSHCTCFFFSKVSLWKVSTISYPYGCKNAIVFCAWMQIKWCHFSLLSGNFSVKPNISACNLIPGGKESLIRGLPCHYPTPTNSWSSLTFHLHWLRALWPKNAGSGLVRSGHERRFVDHTSEKFPIAQGSSRRIDVFSSGFD